MFMTTQKHTRLYVCISLAVALALVFVLFKTHEAKVSDCIAVNDAYARAFRAYKDELRSAADVKECVESDDEVLDRRAYSQLTTEMSKNVIRATALNCDIPWWRTFNSFTGTMKAQTEDLKDRRRESEELRRTVENSRTSQVILKARCAAQTVLEEAKKVLNLSDQDLDAASREARASLKRAVDALTKVLNEKKPKLEAIYKATQAVAQSEEMMNLKQEVSSQARDAGLRSTCRSWGSKFF